MATIKLLRHGFTREPNNRLAGFGEIEATEDGRVLITAAISSGQLTGECATTFDPWFALALAGALTEAAHVALRHRASLDAEKLTEAKLRARSIADSISALDAAALTCETRGEKVAARVLAEQAAALDKLFPEVTT